MDRLVLFLFGMFTLSQIDADRRLAWHASGNYSLVEVSESHGSITWS